jgi:internalin A
VRRRQKGDAEAGKPGQRDADRCLGALRPAPTAAPEPPPRKKIECPTNPAVVDFRGQKGLEAEVRLKLSKPKGDVAPHELKMIKSLNLTKYGERWSELDPCIFPMFGGLKDLFLPPGDYDDLGPLKGLTTLESLRASDSRVKDLRPIAGLGKLDRLDLSKTAVVDLAPISGLLALTELQLDDTPITDLSPLAPLKKLEKLHIRNTAVKDLAPLRTCQSLKLLELQGTPATDTSPLAPQMAKGLKINL